MAENQDTPSVTGEQTQDVNSASSTETLSSNETLNHDGNTPQSIPYNRFKEVNDQKKELEDKLNTLQGVDPEAYAKYVQFDQVMNDNPELALSALAQIVAEKGQDPAQQQALQQQTLQQPQGPSDYQRFTFDTYKNDYQSLMEREGIPQEHRDQIFKIVADEAAQLNPQALNQYDRALVNKAWEKTKPLFDGIRRQERENIVADQSNNSVPATSGGEGSPSVAVKDPDLSTREQAAAHLAAQLRAIQS